MQKKVRNKGTREIRTINAEFRVDRSGDKPKITGYAVRFNQLSDPIWGFFKEKISPGAFRNALKISDPRALQNHDPNLILGRMSAGTLTVKEDEEGLRYEIFPPDTSYAADLMASIERGDVRESSFAMIVSKEEWDDSGELSIRTILEVEELFDVSPVTYPAYPSSSVGLRSHEAAEEVFKDHRELCESREKDVREAIERDAVLRSQTLELMK